MRASTEKITEKTKKENKRNTFHFKSKSNYMVVQMQSRVVQMWCLLGCRKKREDQRGDRFHSLISGFGTEEMMRPFAEVMNLVQFFPPGREPYILSKISPAPVRCFQFTSLVSSSISGHYFSIPSISLLFIFYTVKNKTKTNATSFFSLMFYAIISLCF